MNITLFLSVVVLLTCAYVWIGKRASNELETTDDYFLMGRKLSLFPLMFTLLATQLGGGTLLGAAQEAYSKGWIVLLFPLGTCLGLFVLGMGFGKKLRDLNVSTLAEVFEKIFLSQLLRKIASILSMLSLFFILVSQGIAAKKFFITLGLENPLFFISFWSVLIIYTVMGGFKAVVYTDVLQAGFILVVIAITFIFADFSNIQTARELSTLSFEFSQVPWTAWLLMPLLFILIEQDMGQRCFAAKKGGSISIATISSGILLMACSSFAIYFGIVGKELGISISDNESILLSTVEALCNPTVVTLFVAALFMAVVSTADSLLCSISSNLTCDFMKSKNVSFSRFLTLLIGIGSLALTFIFDNVISMLVLSYELSVCILFIPTLLAILLKQPSKQGAVTSIIAGSLSFIFLSYYSVGFPKELFCLGISLSSYLFGSFIRINKWIISDDKSNCTS
jgi:SSS family solute:Na+ symporter